MDLFEAIRSRATAARLKAPGPTREDLERIIGAGVHAPDHGRLRPWRFVVLQGSARERLGESMAQRLREKVPDATPEQLDNERRKALRAPTIIVAAARITKGKIPDIEQIEAVTAAVQNMLLAAHGLGYGAMWKTGPAAYDPNTKALLGLSAEDHIVALLYMGTIDTPGQLTPRSIDGIVSWID